jgi:predicted methyltransferase
MKRRAVLSMLPAAAFAPAFTTVLPRLSFAAALPAMVPGASLKPSADLKKAMASARRPTEDIKRDDARKPAETMTFFGIKPGMKVAELMTATGYFTAVLAETVGDTGKVYGQNNKWLRDRFKDGQRPLANLIDKGGYKNIVELNSELDDPMLPEGLDAVFMIMFYHDTVWMNADRAAMNRAVLKALKPGGVYGIIDHVAPAGAGLTEVNKTHRIERQVVVNEITAAGFQLAEETDLLANPKDPLTVPVFQQELRGHTNQFVLKFKKA